MGRIRSLKPEFGHSEKLSAEHSEVHLLAALLLTYADDEGYFNANPKLVQAACCPLRELFMSVPEILMRLTAVGYIEMLPGEQDRMYARVVNFFTHQRVAHPTASKIKLLVKSPENIVRPPDTFTPDLGTGNREQGKEGFSREPLQHPLNHARRMMEVLGLSERILRSIEAGLVAEVQFSGNDLSETAQFITNWCIEKRRCGMTIDRFTFDSTKWRTENGNKQQVSPSVSRDEQTCESLLTAARNHAAKRDSIDGGERKNSPRSGDQRRIPARAL